MSAAFYRRMTESKDALRARLRDLPIAEKLRIVEQLNRRALAINPNALRDRVRK